MIRYALDDATAITESQFTKILYQHVTQGDVKEWIERKFKDYPDYADGLTDIRYIESAGWVLAINGRIELFTPAEYDQLADLLSKCLIGSLLTIEDEEEEPEQEEQDGLYFTVFLTPSKEVAVAS